MQTALDRRPRRLADAITLAAGMVAMATAAPAAHASTHRVNDTGLSLCIDAASQFTDCAGTGQDGEFGRDVTHPFDANGRAGFRYTRLCNSGEREGEGSCPAAPPTGNGRNDWGCTHDQVSGLTWEVKTGDGGRRDGSRSYTFYSPEHNPDGLYGGPRDATGFLNAVNAAGLCGASDWRVPTPSELVGIADMGITTIPAVDTRFLPNTVPGFYWATGSVRGRASGEALAWGADFSFGFGAISAQFRSSQFALRVVRGAQPGAGRYTVSADEQEVSDHATGLIWRRCAEGLVSEGGQCTGKPLRLAWPDALAHARQQALDTGTAWRLPNAKELGSLLDHNRSSHIDTQAFPSKRVDMHWASSAILIYRIPRCVSFSNGTSSFCNSFIPFSLRLVRDAP